eukprot:4297041-Pyramimonas_sp.AAC.1
MLSTSPHKGHLPSLWYPAARARARVQIPLQKTELARYFFPNAQNLGLGPQEFLQGVKGHSGTREVRGIRSQLPFKTTLSGQPKQTTHHARGVKAEVHFATAVILP